MRYRDFLTRESVASALEKLQLNGVLNSLDRLDDLPMNSSLPFLGSLATYAIDDANK